MGNQQSVLNPNRLSKPQTYTTSPSLSVLVDSPIPAPSRYVDLSVKGRQQIREALLSPAQTELESAVGSVQNDNAVEMVPQIRGRRGSINSRSNSRSNSLSWFGSRHETSSKLASFSDSKISLNSITQTDGGFVVNEVLDTSEEPGVPVSAPEQGLSRSASDMSQSDMSRSSSSSLTRRRSLLQTPGVATRHGPTEGDRRQTWNSWKTPQLDPNEEAKWRATPKRMAQPKRLAALNVTEETCEPTTPRAGTPGALDYSHLGNLRLGSLVVTNGAASPVPSTKTPRPRVRSAGDDDYFSAIERSASPVKKGNKPYTQKNNTSLATSKVANINVRSKMDDLALDKPLPTLPEPSPRDISPDVHSRETTTTLSVNSNRTPTPPTQHADSLALIYRAELSPSPFDRPMEDNIEEDNRDLVPEGLFSMNRTFPHTVNGKQPNEPATTTVLTSPHSISTNHYMQSEDQWRTGQRRRPVPRSFDSGYSSGGSLRVAGSGQVLEAQPTNSAQRSNSPPKDNDMKLDSRMQLQNAPIMENEQQLSLAPSPEPETHRPPPLKLFSHIAKSSTRSSISDIPLSPQTPHSIASKASFESTSSNSKKRLYRRRPSQPELPVVQSCQPIPEGTIPQVPDSVRVQFTRRLSHTPGIECLTHTYPTKEHVLATESVSDPVTISKPSQIVEIEPDRQHTPPARQTSLSLFRKKSTPANDEAEDEIDMASAGFVDLGMIPAMLGSSPYDAAMLPQEAKYVSNHSPQIGNGLPRAKSMTNMDAEAAADWARRRSKDRGVVEREPKARRSSATGHQNVHDPFVASESSPIQQRRRSFHNLKLDIGEATASKRRPPSSFEDIPPVPRIDPSKILIPVPHTAMPRLESKSNMEAMSNPISNFQPYRHGRAASHQTNNYGCDDIMGSQKQVDWEPSLDLWSQRRKLIGEGLRRKNEFAETKASKAHSRTMSQAFPSKRESVAAWTRGVGGSAVAPRLENWRQYEGYWAPTMRV